MRRPRIAMPPVARLQAARAALSSAREGVDYTEVRAPYAGIVTQRHVEVGESVAPGTPLVSGLSLQYLRVGVDIPQRRRRAGAAHGKAAVYVDDRRVPATKLTIFPVANPQSNTFRARVDLPENAADLYPGHVREGRLRRRRGERLDAAGCRRSSSAAR